MRFSAYRTGFLADSTRQKGQALVESLVALLALAVLWVALNWLAHYQDAALSATHASRHAAFVASRGEQPDGHQAEAAPFFTGSAHHWKNRKGQAVLEFDISVSTSRQRLPPLSAAAQPGAGSATATTLRREWSLADEGILRARVALDFIGLQPLVDGNSDASLLKLQGFDRAYPPLSRSISILTGAGHAGADDEVQSRVAASSLAWAAAHGVSRAAGTEITMRAEGVEGGWGRSAADFDWLQPWSGQVPGHLLSEYAANGGN